MIEAHLSDAFGFLKFGWRKLFITILLILGFFWIQVYGPLRLIIFYIIASIVVTLIDKTLAYTSSTKKVPEWYEFDIRVLIVSLILSSPLIIFWLTLAMALLGITIVPELLGPIWIIIGTIFHPLVIVFLGTILGNVVGFIVIGISMILLSILVGIIPSALIIYFFDKIRKKSY